ncbi:hypothetical protein ACT3SZ_06490 [Corynebacterium sp. AOP40-9SA-29]|uniref:hypothetical protein n=1 Tax=Corynebacterium sp. AOP40-9SA-29 TaxID=3457677 RepID=UPI0040345E53
MIVLAGSVLSLIGIIATAIYQLRGKSAEQGPEWYRTLSAEVKTLREDMAEMRREMDGMRTELSGLQIWKTSALALIRQLLAKVHPDEHPVIPPEVRKDLDATH